MVKGSFPRPTEIGLTRVAASFASSWDRSQEKESGILRSTSGIFALPSGRAACKSDPTRS